MADLWHRFDLMSANQQVLAALGAGASAPTDPYLSSVKLLMGFEGADGATGSPGMDDESPSARGTASGGSTHAKISTAQAKFGSSSLLMDGSGRIDFPDSNDWNLSNGLFTVELFIRPSTVSGTQFLVGQWLSAGNLGWILYLANDKLTWNVSTNGSNNLNDIAGSTSLSANAWQFVAIDYDGTKYRTYVGSAMDGSSSTARTIFDSSNVLGLGANNGGSAFWYSGHMDELRITKGVARYASDSGLTVPTAAFPRS